MALGGKIITWFKGEWHHGNTPKPQNPKTPKPLMIGSIY